MNRIARGALVWLHLCLTACSNAGTSPDGGVFADAAPRPDGAVVPDVFHHFAIDVQPAVPLVDRNFEVRVIAYRDETESSVLGYDGSITVTASVGTLSGETQAQIRRGQAAITLQTDSPGDAVTLTVTDDTHPERAGTSAPFRVSPLGDIAAPLAVVLNEVNWFGNSDTGDEWIELRNPGAADLNLSEWIIENAGTPASPTLMLENGTVVPAGGYLVIGSKRGPDEDGMRTSLTGVEAVQLHPLSLNNAGEQLILRDAQGSIIDATPDGGWPAGNNTADLTMERRDDLTGGGYAAGELATSWYHWNSLDGTDTTQADTSDRGTPAAANTDPDIFDHFVLAVSPNPPRAATDFTLSVTAYRSSDDSSVLTEYSGTVSVTSSPSGLSGQTSNQPITAGMGQMVLRRSTPAPELTLTVTDTLYPDRTGSITVELQPVGDSAGLRDVVISEVNWYGNGADPEDEWIELRNVSGAELNLSSWTIDAAGGGSNPITIPTGTVLPSGGYLVMADQQGADSPGSRTSLTGVSGVVLAPISLINSGEQLILRDVDDNPIDSTLTGPWPAGVSAKLWSMERRDDLTGGGYTDGSDPDAWASWNPADGRDTTHPDSADHGTPGAANTDPAAFFPPMSLPYSTGLETGQPAWENLSAGGFSNTPPPGTSARSGSAVFTTDSVTTDYAARQIQTVGCITLDSDSAPLTASVYATASTENGDNQITARVTFLWFTDQVCSLPHNTSNTTPVVGTVLPAGSYTEVTGTTTPPAGATHVKLRLGVRDNNAGPNNAGDDWAADDVSLIQ